MEKLKIQHEQQVCNENLSSFFAADVFFSIPSVGDELKAALLRWIIKRKQADGEDFHLRGYSPRNNSTETLKPELKGSAD
jgi:hypothetical protein